MRVVIALGGNALLKRGEPMDAANQRRNVTTAAQAIASVAAEHEVIVTHGNGPQVGLLALQAEAYKDVSPYPLDVLGAESEGMIGFLIEEQLRPALPDREIVTLLTPVLVDEDDPAFAQPTKPVGPVYDEPTARQLAVERGWSVAQDGAFYRRVVPSPEPRRIIGINAIRLLAGIGAIVICAGGGGVPVVEDGHGALRGVEAVIDKDLCAALLARESHADALLLLTDVEGVYSGWGTDDARLMSSATVAELATMDFAPGSMAPKVEAACRFVEWGGQFAAIGALENGGKVLDGLSGTKITS